MTDEDSSEPFYIPKFQTALRSGNAIVKDAFSALKSAADGSRKNDTLNQLLDNASQLTQRNTISARTIAVVGDSGQGISSVSRYAL